MESWKEQFQAIEACIVVSDGVNDFATEKFENIQCGCKPSFVGEKICKDNRCINYAIQTECVRCDAGCCNNRIRNKENANLVVKETPGKGHGLFAAEDLRKQQFLREYVGELISPDEFARRSTDKTNPSEHQYIMQLKNGVYLDASRKGSISRFINHSCEPNCFVEIWTVQGHLRVGIFTMCNIPAGTELTFDYKWRRSSRPPTRCFCGSEYCRGYLEIMSADELDALKVRKGQWRIGGELLSVQLKRNKASLSAGGGLNSSLSAGLSDTSDLHSPRPPSEGMEECKSISRESSEAELSSDSAQASALGGAAGAATASGAVSASSTTTSATATAATTTTAVEVLENDIYDSSRRLVPAKLIGKRVKVWWEGNLAFLEADVESYNSKTNKYLCKYEVDGSVSEEDFGPSVGSKLPPSSTAAAGAGGAVGVGANGVSTGAATAAASNGGGISGGVEVRSSVSGLSGNNGVHWKWLDETAEEIVIKKKTNAAGDDLLKDYEVITSPSSAAAPSSASFQKTLGDSYTNTAFTALNVTDRCVEVLAPGVARFVADMYGPESELSKSASFTSMPNYTPWQNFQQICQLNFSVRATLSGTSSGGGGGGGGGGGAEHVSSQNGGTVALQQQVVMYGQSEKLATVRELLRAAEKALQQSENSDYKHLRKTLLNRQGVILSKDWRFKPEKSVEKAPTTDGLNRKASAAFQSYFLEKLKTLPDLSCVNCLPFDYLPNGIGADSGTEVAENVRKSLFSNMQGLSARLGFSTQAAMNAFMLLVRFLRFPLGNARENTAVLAGVALIVAKLNGEFRHKMTKSIVKSAYCQVFNRDESDISDESIVPYIEAALSKERLIFARVQNDIFSADVVPSLQAFVRAGLWSDHWCLENDTVISEPSSSGAAVTNQKDKHKDREAEKMKRKKIATFEYESNIRNVVRRSVLNNAELLAQELLYTYSTSGSGAQEGSHLVGNNGYNGGGNAGPPACAMVLCCLPVELLQLGSLVFVSLLSASLPSGTEHRRVLSEIHTFTAALLSTTKSLIGCTEALLQWTLEVVAEACAELLTRLDHLSCFAELADVHPQDSLQCLRNVALEGLATHTSHQQATTPVGNGSNYARAPPLPAAPSAPVVPPPPARPATPPRSKSTQQLASQSSLFDSDVPFKTRFPWLSSEDCLDGDSALDVSCAVKLSDFQEGRYVAERTSIAAGSDSLVPITKDVFFGFASLETDSAKFLPPLTCKSRSDAEVDVGIMTLRAWPSHAHISKELKRAGVEGVHQLGLLPGPLAELTVLQHLHYLYHTSAAEAASSPDLLTSGECPYFVAPVGILNFAAADLNANNGLRSTILGVETDVSGGANDNVSLKLGDDARKDTFHTLASLTMDRKAASFRPPEVYIPPAEFDLQFLAFPAVHISLSTILGLVTSTASPRWDLTKEDLAGSAATAHVVRVLQANNGHLLAPALAVELCKDLLCAIAHMISCGVYLKWLSAEHVYVTSAGRLQVGGLSGASYASYTSSSFKALHGSSATPVTTTAAAAITAGSAGNEEEDGFSIPLLSEQLTALRSQHSNNRNATAGTGSSGDKTRRVKRRKLRRNAYADDDDEESNNHTERLRRVAKKLALPRGALYTVAPEVILGGPASPESTVYSASAVCAQILTGKALVKNASSDDKQLQYIYKVLGTPKPMGFLDFDTLPLAQLYGRHIQEDNSDSRSRAFRVFKEQCPAPLLHCFSFTHPQPLPQSAVAQRSTVSENSAAVSIADVQKVISLSDTDYTGVVDLVRVSMQLVPQRRLPVELLLQFALFRVTPSTLSSSLTTSKSGHKARVELQTQKLRLSGSSKVLGGGGTITALSNKSRLSFMEELVTSLRAVQRVQIPTSVQKKDIYYHPVSENDLVKLNQMDGLLFRLEREKYREVVKSPVYDDHRENRTRTVSPGNYSSSSAPLPPLPPRTPQAPAGPAAAPVFVPRADTREAYSYGGHSNSQHYDAYHSGSGGDGGRYYHSHGHSSMPPQYGYGAPIVPPRPHLQPQAPYGSSDGYYGNYGGHPHHLGHGGGMNYSGGGGGGSYNYGSYGGSRIEPAYASHSAPLPSAYPQPPPPAVPMSGVPYPRPPAGGDSSTKRGYEAHQSEQQDGKKQRASPY